MINILLLEDHTLELDGLRKTLDDEAAGTRLYGRVMPTFDDAFGLFEGAARRNALPALSVDAVLVDGFLPRSRPSDTPEFVAVEFAIRISALYQAAGIPERSRPCLIYRTNLPDPCDVRAFIAYGGHDCIRKGSGTAEAFRSRVVYVSEHRPQWTPPPTTRPLHGLRRGDWRFLQQFEIEGTNVEIGIRMSLVEDTVIDGKQRVRLALELPERASESQIVQAAKDAGLSWIPLRWQTLAAEYGVESKLDGAWETS